MKPLIIFIFSTLFLQKSVLENNFFTRSNNINRLKKEASFAFWKKNYKPAKEKYYNLINNYKVTEEAVSLNLAHCYFELSDTANARTIYENFNTSKNIQIKSIALQQLGILAFANNNKEKSISLTRQALQINPFNDGARYNYEILKKFNISEKPNEKSENNNSKHTSQKNIHQPSDNKSEKNNEDNKEINKTKNIGLSEEKAKMILDAIQNEENDYMHKKKISKHKNNDKNKPDW